MFYNFGSLESKTIKPNHCNLCNKKIRTCPMKHITTWCAELDTMRTRFSIQLHNKLAKILNQYDQTHYPRFSTEVLKTLEDINRNPSEFWQLTCGANNWSDHDKTFIYSKTLLKRPSKKLTFYFTFLGHLMTFIHRIKYLYINLPLQINKQKTRSEKKHLNFDAQKYKTNRYNTYHRHYPIEELDHWYPHYLDSNNDYEAFKRNNNITQDDIIVATDGAFTLHDNHSITSGTGIWIQHNNNTYEIAQALGQQSILMAEQYPLAKLPYIFQRSDINIDWHNKRMILITDNQTTFESIYSKPKNPTFPNILNSIRTTTMTHPTNHIVLKAAAHLDEHNQDPIKPNEYADTLAVQGKQHCQQHNIQNTPPLPSFAFSKVHICQSHPRGFFDMTIPFDTDGIG